MRGTFVRKLALILAALMSALVLVGPIPAGAEDSEERTERLEPLGKCVPEKPSSWLLLVDTSISLRRSDPGNERVKALTFAVDMINDFRTSYKQDAYIEILEFGETTRRPDGLGTEWRLLDESYKSTLDGVIRGLAEANKDYHTDYLRALRPWHPDNPENMDGGAGNEIGVLDLFKKQQEDTCQVLLWFSDGKLSLEENYKSNSLPESFTTPYNAKRGEKGDYEKKLLDELCSEGGPVDELRGGGEAEFGSRNATYVITVGLGKEKDFGLLEAIAEGNTSTRDLKTHHGQGLDKTSCGSKPGLGAFFSSEDVYGLKLALLDAFSGRETEVCSEDCPLIVGFEVSAAVTYFMMVISAAQDVAVELRGPGGKEYALTTITERRLGRDGTLSINAADPRSITIAANRPTDSGTSWIGTWEVQFSTQNPENSIFLNPIGKLQPLLVDKFVREGEEPVLTFELNLEHALMEEESLTGEQLEDENLAIKLDIRVRQEGMSDWMELDEDPPDDPSITSRRSYRGTRALQSNGPLTCEVKLEATYTYIEGIDPIRLSDGGYKPCEGVGVDARGELPVRDKATFPMQCEPGRAYQLDDYFDYSDRSNEYIEEICFKAGENGAGFVQYMPEAPSFPVVVDVEPDRHDFEEGDEKWFTVRFTAANEDLETFREEKSTSSLVVQFKSTSSQDASSDTYSIAVSYAIKNSTILDPDWTKIILYTLGSFLLPLFLLYFYNFFWGSRFTRTGPLQRVDVEVVVRNGQLFPAQGKNSIINAEDFGPHAGVRSRNRKFHVIGEVGQAAEMVGRVPKMPLSEPWAEGRFLDGVPRYVLSEQGTSKDLTAGRLAPAAAPAWLLGILAADSAASGLSEDWQGRLLVVLPSGAGKTAEASFEELLPQINRVLDEHNDPLHEWQSATPTDSSEPAGDGRLGPDDISPPEIQLPGLPGDEIPKSNNFPEIPD